MLLIHCCSALYNSLVGSLSTCTPIHYERGVPVCGSGLQNALVGGSALHLRELLTRIQWYLLSQVTLLVLTFSVFYFSAGLSLLLRLLLR